MNEFVRHTDQFQELEKWVQEGEDGSTLTQNGKTLKKTAIDLDKHPGLDALGIVRNIFQGPRDTEVTIMELRQGWKIEVVDQ